jgi:cyclic pyranopterin phosphate synthase
MFNRIPKTAILYNKTIIRFNHTLTHVTKEGKAQLVNVSNKDITLRSARATANILLGKDAFELVQKNQIKKGDVLTVAKIAGIQAAKQTGFLIPLCHPLQLTRIEVECVLESKNYSVTVNSLVSCDGKTGVEMEAITAVSIAACTIYDMCKAVNKAIEITDIKLIHKSGGKSCEYNYKSGGKSGE